MIRISLLGHGGRPYRMLVAGVVPEDLPDPATMSVEDLRAEIAGGRIAFAHVVEHLRYARERVRALSANHNHYFPRRPVQPPWAAPRRGGAGR